MTVRTRIAPSPTGIAHIGTAYIGLLNYAFARANSGKFVLRIEDTDRKRYLKGAETVIFAALHWLGLDYDEGPDIGGPFAPYTQSERLKIYKQLAEQLLDQDKAYYCFCSAAKLEEMRKRQQQQGKPPMYDESCRKLDPKNAKKRATTEKHVIRLKVRKEGTTSWNDLIRGKISFENNRIDDQVLLKSDGYPTYHLAVVADDHLMEISHVIRGEEWISSTPKHIMLYQAFGWTPPEFAHTPLLRNPDRSKLSKRRNPVSILWYKEQGYLPEALVNYLCLMGWSHPKGKDKFPLEEFISNFSLDRIKTTAPVFDLGKLQWLNSVYIRDTDERTLLKLLKPYTPKTATQILIRRLLPLVRERIHLLSEFRDQTEFFVAKPKIAQAAILAQSKHSKAETEAKLLEFAKLIGTVPIKRFQATQLEEEARRLTGDNWSPTKLFMTVRLALTGKTATPPLFDIIEILGKKETLERLRDVINKLK